MNHHPTSPPLDWERPALAGGILFSVFQFASLLYSFRVVVPTHASVDAPPEATASALAANEGIIATGTYLTTIPMPFLLLFLGGLHEILRRAPGGGPALATATTAAGIVSAVLVPFGAVFSGLSAPVARAGGDPAVVKELDSITPLAMALSGYSYALLAGLVSSVVVRGRIAPRWVGWLGLGFSATALASTATVAIRGLFPLTLLAGILFPAWAMTLSVSLLRRSDRVTNVHERPPA